MACNIHLYLYCGFNISLLGILIDVLRLNYRINLCLLMLLLAIGDIFLKCCRSNIVSFYIP